MAESDLPLLAWRPAKERDARKTHKVGKSKSKSTKKKTKASQTTGKRRRSMSSRQRDQVLSCLMAAYPDPISHAAICETVQTNRASHRIRELARAGWKLEGAGQLGLDPQTQTQLYRLSSLRKGTPDVKHLGLKVLWDRGGLKVSLHRDIDGDLGPDFLHELAGKIEEMVVLEVGDRLSPPEES